VNERGRAPKPGTPDTSQTATNGKGNGNTTDRREQPPRDFVMAARAGRAAIDRARACCREGGGKLQRFDRDVLDALVQEIVLYSRTSADIGTRRLASIVYGVPADDLDGWKRDRVCKSLRRLDRAGVVFVAITPGRASRTVVTFPTDSEHGSNEPDSHEKDGSNETDSDTETRPVPSRNPAHTVEESGNTGGPRREGLREGLYGESEAPDFQERAKRILAVAQSRARYEEQKARVAEWNAERVAKLITDYPTAADDVFIGHLVDGRSSLRYLQRAS
jgi:hypothetical protein